MLSNENGWQDALLVQLAHGGFGLYASKEEVLADSTELPPDGKIRFRTVRFNFNDGKPLVDVGNGRIISIVNLQASLSA